MKATKITTILFLILCFFSMCKKDSKKDADNANGVYYVRGTLNGQALNWQVPANGNDWVVGSRGRIGNDMGHIIGGITALVSGYPGFKPQLGVEFKTFHRLPDGDGEAAFNNFVTTGAWTYTNNEDYVVGKKEFAIYYMDSAGKEYSSIPGAQSGSTANIISATPVSGSVYNADSGLKIKLTFSCTLYPVDGTGSSIKINITDATVFLDNLIVNS